MVQEEILGFQVAVHDADGVRLVERACDLAKHARDLSGWKWTVLRHDLLQVTAMEKLHHEKWSATELRRAVCVEHADDVFALDSSRCSRLAFEAFDRLCVGGRCTVKHLQSGTITCVDVLDEKHLAHAAPPDLRQHAIT